MALPARRKHNTRLAYKAREKVCPTCRTIFIKSGKLSYAQWDEMVFCSRPCARLKPIGERLLEHSVWKDDCLIWAGPKDKDGYGTIAVLEDGKRKTRRVHRIAYQEWNGSIPYGKLIMHSCDNPACINRKHLSTGTPLDNVADKMAKGRHRARSGETHPNSMLSKEQSHMVQISDLRQVDLAKLYGVSRSVISRARKGVLNNAS